MAIQDEMYKMIAQEIDLVVKEGREKVLVDIKKAKKVAQMLTELSVEKTEADSLVNQYMANIKNICNSWGTDYRVWRWSEPCNWKRWKRQVQIV